MATIDITGQVLDLRVNRGDALVLVIDFEDYDLAGSTLTAGDGWTLETSDEQVVTATLAPLTASVRYAFVLTDSLGRAQTVLRGQVFAV